MKNWAVIKSGSIQYKVEEGDQISVEKLNVNRQAKINFDQVLLISRDGKIELGKPLIDKAKVKVKVLGNYKEKKVRVVKFKSKSRYLRTRGHRQEKTNVLIEKISS